MGSRVARALQPVFRHRLPSPASLEASPPSPLQPDSGSDASKDSEASLTTGGLRGQKAAQARRQGVGLGRDLSRRARLVHTLLAKARMWQGMTGDLFHSSRLGTRGQC